MKLIATILALSATYPVNAPIEVLAAERKIKLDFGGGFNGLCNREAIADMNALALETFHVVLKGQDGNGFHNELSDLTVCADFKYNIGTGQVTCFF